MDTNNALAQMTPPPAARAFIDDAGWEGARILPLAGDASFRRYFRVVQGDRQAVLMDAPPPHEDPRPFVKMADYLCGHGLRAPAILARDLAAGLILLEDLGDRRMREHLDANPHDETAIYEKAIGDLLRVRALPVADVPAYDAAAYLREVKLVTEWYAPAAGLDVDAAGYEALWAELLAPVLAAQAAPVTVLRDYHAENIMLLPDGRLGHLDFQDALAGHPAYDVVSLLQDARRDVSPQLEAAMLDFYAVETGAGEEFRLHYALLGAQRNAKIIGIFTRLWQRDKKPHYMGFMPRMWGLLERDLAHPALGPMQAWFDANIPHEVRRRDLLAAEI